MKLIVWLLWRGGERLHQLGVAMKRLAHALAANKEMDG